MDGESEVILSWFYIAEINRMTKGLVQTKFSSFGDKIGLKYIVI